METLRIVNVANRNISFRSLGEIERALDQIRSDMGGLDAALDLVTAAVTITHAKRTGGKRGISKTGKRFEVLDTPTQSQLEKNFKLITDLDAKIQSVDSILAQLEYQFKGDTAHKAVLSGAKALRAELNGKIKTAYTAVNKIAKGKVSKTFTDYTDTVATALEDQLDYESVNERLFIDVFAGNLRYTYYLTFEKLRDSTGYESREYNICLSHVIGVDTDLLYVNTILKFATPGKFQMGTQVSNSDEALDVVAQMLRSEGFRNIMGTAAQPLADEDLDRSKFGEYVQKIEVTDDAVVFTLDPKAKQSRSKIVGDLYLMFQGLVDSKLAKKGNSVKYKESGNKVSFYVATTSPIRLNRTQLRVMQSELGLTDGQVKQIIQLVL